MPPSYILVGARRWLDLLATSSAASAMAIFMAQPKYADLTFSNYRESYEWLDQQGLLGAAVTGEESVLERAFLAVIAADAANLAWLQDGVVGVPSPDFLPEPVLAAANLLGLDPSTAWQEALQLGSKVDLERRGRIGALGELALVRYLQSLSIRTDHASVRSDGLGWDVRAICEAREFHMEVKSTTSLARLRVYLSRNEFEVSCQDPRWSLVAVLIDDEGSLLRVAHVEKSVLRERVPADAAPLGRWQSCSIDMTRNDVVRGLPGMLGSKEVSPIAPLAQDPMWWPSDAHG